MQINHKIVLNTTLGWTKICLFVTPNILANSHKTNTFYATVLSSHPRQYSYSHVRTVYPKKYAHGFVVLCFVVVTQSLIMNSHEVFIHIHQGCFASTGAIVRLPQCQWSKPDGYGKISQCITTTKHSKAKTVCIFLGIYCSPGICCWFSETVPTVATGVSMPLCCRLTLTVTLTSENLWLYITLFLYW